MREHHATSQSGERIVLQAVKNVNLTAAVNRISSLDYVGRLQAFRSLHDVELHLLPFT